MIEATDESSVETPLRRLGLLRPDETVQSIAPAGAGNMNVVLRVRTSHRSLIIKQSRPYVAKYPQIVAPASRAHAEIDFYRCLVNEPPAHAMPRLLAADRDAFLLVMEDLGASADQTCLYHASEPDRVATVFDDACRWLTELHSVNLSAGEASRVGDDELRLLNHDHLFVIPLRSPPAIDLESVCLGLESVAVRLRDDLALVELTLRLGEIYRHGTGRNLLHGDFFPGSWLWCDDELRIIDPEFCFVGPVEFDLGVLLAHRRFCEPSATAASALRNYGHDYDNALVEAFAGCEMIRRLIGVAQLDLSADLDLRRRWLDQGRRAVRQWAKTADPSSG